MTAHATRSTALATPTLKPLMLAILTAFPLYSDAQVAVVAVNRPAAPAAYVVPRPMPGWRVSGSGAAAPVNVTNPAGGTDQSINQTSPRGIYSWQTFDVGVASSVTFNFPSAESSALNRVAGSGGSAAPSQIFGALKSQYIDTRAGANGAPVIGGSVYLVNANGILFGRSAQVNVGALIASTLNLGDADFLSGLTNSIAGAVPSFKYDGAPELFTDANNFVRVDAGAQLTTASGGRVFLFAKNVQNAGAIATPSGQTVLAAGAEVYLQSPTAERLYASEVNPDFPVVRGLLVEVGSGAGTASNLTGATIDSVRGNTTLVGLAVNQLGRVSATTSVAQNGSVLLLARANATAVTDNGALLKHATTSGRLTLGAGSLTEIGADTALDAQGQPVTSDANSTFTTSRVELAGLSVALQSGAQVVAHGGIVNARAQVLPYYQSRANGSLSYDPAAFTGDASARLIVADQARIDVSGTTRTSVSVAREFVTTALLGKSDLKDAPLQKDGPLYRSKVTFDVRRAAPILGDTSTYVGAIRRSVDERLASGGSVTLTSTGALVAHPGASLDVAGGQITYTAALVTPTRLIGADGSRQTLAQAPKDSVYIGLEAGSTPSQNRWGVVPQYLPSQAQTGHLEAGYVDAQAGGTLTVVAPQLQLDAQLLAGTGAGTRQRAGADAAAAASRLNLGFRNNGSDTFGSASFITTGLRELVIGASVPAPSATFWSDPLTAVVAASSRISAATLNASGVGALTISVDGGLVLQAGADLHLASLGALDLAAGGAAGITLGAGFRAEGGSVTARTRDLGGSAVGGATRSGGITLQGGAALDVSAAYVNRALDGATPAAATAGGIVTLSSARALNLGDASRVDVSGGVTVSTAGVVQGTSAGSITLESDVRRNAGDLPSVLHVGADLRGNSLSGGGTLALHGANTVTIGSGSIPRGVQDGVSAGVLQLSEAFFRHGAFTRYDVQAISALQVERGTLLLPQASNWLARASAAQVASGALPASVFEVGQLAEARRLPVSLLLGAVTPYGANPSGRLTLATGAQISTDPLATVTLTAGLNLDVQGGVRAPGGNVNLALRDMPNVGSVEAPLTGLLRVGAAALLDVSGVSMRKPQTGVLVQGSVLAGGNIAISTSAITARLTPVEVLAGAVLNADGASDTLGVTQTTAAGGVATLAQTVNSVGGSITINAREGGATLAGDMHAVGGGGSNTAARAASGAFSLQLSGVRTNVDPVVNLVDSYTIVVQQKPVTVSAADAVPGSVQLSAQALSAGFADLSLRATDRIRFNDNVTLALARNLVLDAPLLTAAPNVRSVMLVGGSSVLLGSTPDALVPTATTPIAGNAALALQGGLVEFYGSQGLRGFRAVNATAASEIRLRGVTQNGVERGQLALQADLTLNAPQVSASANSNFTIDAAGQKILITGGNASAALATSAGAAVTINAREITTRNPLDASQYGVLRAPFGSLTLNASDRIDIGPGSVLSVSGSVGKDSASVLYGSTVGGTGWNFNNAGVGAPVVKTISLNAPGKSVNVSAGATLDAAGGGDLIATEFVAGSGGSKDVFSGAAGGAFAVFPGWAGFVPQDADTLGQVDASGASARVQLGRQISLGAGAPLPAGTYTVLPARYALLAGAFLVRPVTSTAPFALGAAVARVDGSVLVGGQLSDAGGSAALGASSAVLPQTFQVLTSVQAQAFSEIRQTSANAYFASLAAAAGAPVPALPQDAGRVNIAADQLVLKGSTLFAHSATSLGGELDISAKRIRIASAATGSSAGAMAGVLTLTTADLNATGAALLVLGGLRTGSALQTTASAVVVDNAGETLSAADLLLTATNRVELMAGAGLRATATTPSANSAPLALSGDGALLRVSADASARSVRTDAQRLRGDLVIGAASVLHGAAVTAEATHTTTIASDAVVQAARVTIGANRIAVGEVDATQVDATTLVITPTLAAQLRQSQALTLRSYDGIDLYGAATMGGSAVRALTLDAGQLRVHASASDEAAGVASNGSARVEAGGIQLVNTSGSDSSTHLTNLTLGGGQLQLVASGAAKGSGQVVIGPGSMAVLGAQTLEIDAVRELVLSGQTRFATAGDVLIHAATLQATQAADANFSALGNFHLDASGALAASAGAGLGAHVVIEAASIAQVGRIVLPSGALGLHAIGADSADGVQFGAASTTDVSGRASRFDGVRIATSGGTLHVGAASGGISIEAGAVLDVSAASTPTPTVSTGTAGQLTLAAPAGSVTIGGSLRGVSFAGQGGGASLSIDSAAPVDLAALAVTLASSSLASGSTNFSESLNVRNRSGDQQLSSATLLAAHHITLSADAGGLDIAGALDASGSSGTTLTLAAGTTLALQSGARLSAHSTGAVGGEVRLLAGVVQVQDDASLGVNGQIQLNGGRIDTSGAAALNGAAGWVGVDGSVLLRAQRDASNRDVAVGKASSAGNSATSVRGATRIEIEAVKQYQTASIGSTLLARVSTDNAAFAGTGGANAQQVRTRVAGLFSPTAQPLPIELRAGVEGVQLDPGTDLVVTGKAANNGWNLTSFDSFGQALAQPTGAPINLTLRAAGNLLVQASLSDGFVPAAAATAALAAKIAPAAVAASVAGHYLEGARIRLVGGADLSAADVMATLDPRIASAANSGDVTLGASGKDVLVRSTTGSIEIAAARDLTFLNRRAAVYTTGTPVDHAPGFVGQTYLFRSLLANPATAATPAQAPFLSGGGSVSVQAARDLIGASGSAPQYGSEWLWRGLDASTGQPVWWARYDKFQQGVATFGGGNATLSAGRDALNVEAAVASSGFVANAANTANAASTASNATGVQRYGGGDLSLSAQRDIVAGFVLGDGGTLIARSGRDISAPVDAPGLQVLHGNSQIDIEARRDVDLGLVTSFGLIRATKQAGNRPVASYLTGLAPLASLHVLADAGNLFYRAVATTDLVATAELHNAVSTGIDKVIPDHASFAATAGSVALGALTQLPWLGSSLDVLAQNSATVTSVNVAGSNPQLVTPGMVADVPARNLLAVFGTGQTPLDAGDRAPVRIVAATGDATLATALNATKPLRLLAGRDIVIGVDSSFNGIVVQHQVDAEMTLLQAGRDIVLADDSRVNGADLKVYGPGEVLVVAGRNIDLHTSGGIGTLGNRENAALPATGAALTVLAGVTLPASGALVSAGMAGDSADLAAQVLARFRAFVALQAGSTAATAADTLAAFIALPVAQQLIFTNQALIDEIRSAGRAASSLSGAARDAAYERAYRALAVVFPQDGTHGDLLMGSSQLRTYANSAITVLTPRGGVDVGELASGPHPKPASVLGIVTGAGGGVSIAVRDSVAVNQSRVFTVGQGDLLMWASEGNLDAGRGAKTVTGAPPPVFKFDANGNFVIDTSGSFSGSGIAVLDASSTLDLYAPKGEINAGDAGIKSLGNAFLGAARFVGADNLAIGGVAVGAPPPVASGGDTAGLASVGQASTSAGTRINADDSDDEKARKRRKRMNLILDFLGFGDGGAAS